ncbi:MAG: thioredoxin family protein, partial [Salinimicrobium sediminis]|nr:thioredoxin family protein [Salinimicrobium sediminis]
MRKLLLFFLTQILVVSLFAQQDQISFSEALTTHLPKYKKQADKAYRTENLKRADFLFDSLVKYGLKGSKMDIFKVQDLKKKPVALDDFQKPVYLTTYAS